MFTVQRVLNLTRLQYQTEQTGRAKACVFIRFAQAKTEDQSSG